MDSQLAKRFRAKAMSIRRPLRCNWKTTYPHGIPTTRSDPSRYLADHPLMHGLTHRYWRDVSDRQSMNDKLDAFLTPPHVTVREDSYREAVLKVDDLFGNVSFSRMSIEDGFATLPSSSGSGYPYTVRKGQVTPFILRDAKKLESSSSPQVLPCYGAARRVIRLIPKNAPRLVWVYPAEMAALESTFSAPVTQYLATKPWFGTQVQGFMSKGKWMQQFLWGTPYSQAQHILSTDFSGFDARVPAFVIRSAFRILRSRFPALTRSDLKVFRLIEDYFIHTPINLYGHITQKHRGIPSGSCFTQIIGTLCNMIICHYAAASRGFSIVRGSLWLGDDSRMYVWHYDGLTPAILMQYLAAGAHDLNAELHTDKTAPTANRTKDDDVEFYGSFLSRSIYWTGAYIRFDEEKVLAQALIPEEPDNDPGETLGRLVGLCYAYGFNPKVYKWLSTLHQYVKVKHPHSVPVLKRRFLADLTNALGVSVPGGFPTYYNIRMRYYGYV